jgi:hypothetical protein
VNDFFTQKMNGGQFHLNPEQRGLTDHRLLFIAQSLTHHHIGLEETDDGIWSISFNTVRLAKLDERDYIIRG